MKHIVHNGYGNRNTAGGGSGGGSGTGAWFDSGLGSEYQKCPTDGSGHGYGHGYPCGGSDGDRYATYLSDNSDTHMSYGDCNTSGDQFGGGEDDSDDE